jgi:hypothetical protein
VDEDQKNHDIVDFLQIKQKPSEPVYSFIERFEKQRLRAENMALSLVISLPEKLSWMGSYLTSEGNYKKDQDQGLIKKLKRVQEVVGPDGNLQIQLLQEELLEIKRSKAELVDALERMNVSQKIEPSAKAIEANSSA